MSDRKTTLSPDRKYRYTLWREWNMENDLIATMPGYDRTNEYLNVIAMNPSTADESKNDPTIRRCIDFAQRLGFGALCMTNLFAYRTTYPRELLKFEPTGGPINDVHIMQSAKDAGMIIAGWGKLVSRLQPRAEIVKALIRGTGSTLHCFRRNIDGSPQHPLYIPADTIPVLYED